MKDQLIGKTISDVTLEGQFGEKPVVMLHFADGTNFSFVQPIESVEYTIEHHIDFSYFNVFLNGELLTQYDGNYYEEDDIKEKYGIPLTTEIKKIWPVPRPTIPN